MAKQWHDLSDSSGRRQGAAVEAGAFVEGGFGDGVSGSWLAGMCSLNWVARLLHRFPNHIPKPFEHFLLHHCQGTSHM